MEEQNFSEKILKQIEERKIVPRPKWQFQAENSFFWFLCAFLFLVGSLAFGFIALVLFTQEWRVYNYLDFGFLKYVLMTVPYFWIIFSGLILSGIYFFFSKTKKGYYYERNVVIATVGILALLLGIFLFFADLKFDENNRLLKKFHNVSYDKYDVWSNPKNGLLAGEILYLLNKNDFVLEDFKGKKWRITVENPAIEEGVIFEKGKVVKIIGKTVSGDVFLAKEIRDWR